MLKERNLSLARGLIFLLILLGVAVALSYADVQEYPELRGIARAFSDGTDLSSFFERIAREKGAPYAFELLKRAKLPPNIDIHLLGHAIGDELYRQEGIEGMRICTQDFRNACSHAVVVGAFTEFGEKALPLISTACRQAPGGTGAYTMCYHGLGHGIFAYFGYELSPSMEICQQTGTEARHFREYKECAGGIVMELMGGGGHDRQAWLASRMKYLNSDPLSPCSTELIPEEVKSFCYTYLTPRLFEYAGADLAMPREEHFSKAFSYCDRISGGRTEDRRACFGGLGKEFIVLALQRDVRAVERASEQELVRMKDWCGLAPHREAEEACIESVVSSLYWGGENSPDVANSFCLLAEGYLQGSCFEALFKNVAAYISREDTAYRERVCSMAPEHSVSDCRSILFEGGGR